MDGEEIWTCGRQAAEITDKQKKNVKTKKMDKGTQLWESYKNHQVAMNHH